MAQKTWFFQYDPQVYRARDALDSLGYIHWSVKQHASEIHSGDRVFVWASGPTGGLLAEARVASEPGKVDETDAEKQFYVSAPMPPSDLGVRIEKVRNWSEPALTRDDLKSEPGLANTKLVKMPQGTNFVITADESAAIDRLLEPKPIIADVLKRYRDDRIVFQSLERGAQYCIGAVDEQGAEIRRLSADESARLTFSLHDKRVNELRAGGPIKPSELDGTSAIRAALLQSADLGLSADRASVRAIEGEPAGIELLCELVADLNVDRSTGEPKLYKPILLACVVELIADGIVVDHRLPFDELLPRFLQKADSIGVDAGPDQAAMAFFHLTGDLFWNLAYHDVERRIDSGSVTPAAIRERVQHAAFKEPNHWLLRKHSNRQRVLDALAAAWWPQVTPASPRLGVWSVNQGGSFEKERTAGTIWCPQYDKAGNPQHHWANVSKVEKGDVFFHYAKGDIRAVSDAATAAAEGSKPQELAIGDEWQRPGWHADVNYSDLSAPLQHADLKEMLRRTALPKGPFRDNGDVNQGYLFPLTVRAICLLTERLADAALPPAVTNKLRSIVRSQWSAFINWGRRFLETGTRHASERKWKLEAAIKVKSVRDEFEQGSVNWISALKKTLQKVSATDYRANEDFMEWVSQNPVEAASAFKKLWDHSLPPEKAIDQFWEGVPREVVSGLGTRVSLTSVLISERDPVELPLFRFEPAILAASLTGVWRKGERPGQVYADFLDFLDRVRAEASERGLVLEDRLDAQTLVWCVVKQDPPQEWSEEERQKLEDFREGQDPIMVDPPNPIQQLANKLLIESQFIEDTRRLLEAKGQVIFYGPPGTGKTFIAKALAKHFAGDAADGVEIVQFHPSYAYEDFVEGYRPQKGQSGFTLARGPLRRLARRAEKHPDRKFVLLIDELNRGNVAKVFGELYFLLEYRNEAIRLQYDHGRRFRLPPNLWIIGTMNTADRSIALIDAALRRRFYFLPFFPDESPIAGLLERWLKRHCPKMVWVSEVVDRANETLRDRHGAIGPSHFMRPELDDEWLELIWKHSVIPFLAEQFFGEEDRLKDFALEALKKKSAPAKPSAE